ncbi:MAG: 50S ribosomal protein L25 [Pyramidobacter sp.]|nr:50S ribosomal protein L25 [Pyramidobacter sp.]
MSEAISIVLESREGKGKEYCGRLRKEGYLPAVIYGPAMDQTYSVKVATKSMLPYLMSKDVKNFVFAATLPCGAVKNCVIKSATKNYATDELLHIDFYCAE